MLKQRQKCAYVAPSIEVIEMENEGGVMSASLEGFVDGGTAFSRTHFPDAGVNYSTSSDLEDMINDILTFNE